MLSAERNRLLRRIVVEQGSIQVSAEARRFGVSEETIRRDIKRLAADGIVEPVFGGAVLRGPTEPGASYIPSVGERDSVEAQAKNAIGAAAAEFIEPGQTVILDAGTTTLAVARHLVAHRDLTIVTNSIPIAQACAHIAAASVYLLGGRLVVGSLSLIGPGAERDLSQVSADWAFIGAAAVDRDSGFTSADPYEAQVKRAMISAARWKAIVVDHTKFGARRLASFAQPEDITHVITTTRCPPAARAWLKGSGVTLKLCRSEGP